MVAIIVSTILLFTNCNTFINNIINNNKLFIRHILISKLDMN